MFRQLAPITTLSLGVYIAAPDMINILRETRNVKMFKVAFWDHGEVVKALALGDGSEGKKVLLPKLGMMRVRTCFRHGCEPFAVAAFVEMIASRSPSGAAVLGVIPLQEIGVDIPSSSNTLKADMDAVLEQWGHKTDMPHIQYERYGWD